MKTEKLVREFKYGSLQLVDPDPAQTPEEVKAFYANTYAELNNAEIEGPDQKGGKTIYTFRKAVGTKGAVVICDVPPKLAEAIHDAIQSCANLVVLQQRSASRRYRQRHPDRINTSKRRRTANLNDSYVKDVLKRATGIRSADIPKELLDAKKAELTLRRSLRRKDHQ